MPTYDLKCQNCGHEFSAFSKISERDNLTCPKCDSDRLKTIFKSFNSYKGGVGSKSSDIPLPPPSGFG